MQRFYKFTFVGLTLLTFPMSAKAQSLGGVFGPTVNEGQSSAQYRVGYSPDTELTGQRIHYQNAPTDNFQWRVVLQGRETATEDLDFDYVGGEVSWQLSDKDQKRQHGLRFDVRFRGDDRPHSFGVNWSNQWAFNKRWRARAIVLSSVDFGENTRDGVFLQTRGQLNYALSGGHGVGLELFNSYGSTDGFRDFDDQSHEFGPYVSLSIHDDWSVFVSGLVGLTDGSQDSNLKFWVTRNF